MTIFDGWLVRPDRATPRLRMRFATPSLGHDETVPGRGTTPEALRARRSLTIGFTTIAVSLAVTILIGLVIGWAIFG
jgi:hypothetical protein